jgi:ATP-binding cassette subfamily B protein
MNDKNKSSRQVGGHGFGPGRGMGMPVERAKNFKGTFNRLLTYLKPLKVKLLLVFLCAVLGTIFSIVSPKILGKAITKLFEGMMLKFQGVPGAHVDFNYIAYILIILIGIYLISSVFMYIQQYIMAGVAQNIVYALREQINKKLTRLPLKYYDTRTNGETLSRVTNDIDNISNTLQQGITQLLTSVITIVGVIIMMLTISPLLTLICLVTLPLSFIVTILVAKRSQRYFKDQQKTLGELNGHVEEMFTGHQIVRAYGREKQSINKFKKINEDLFNSGWKAQFISGVIMPLIFFINNLSYVLICVVGGVLVTKRTIEIGDIQAFIQYARQFGQPISQLASITNIIQSTIASAERVFEVLDEDEIVNNESLQMVEHTKGHVVFEEVEFSYKENETLIKNMNLDVTPGQTVAIVGPTGAGKTTLVNLLMRFYELNGGKITIDGIDISKISHEDLRNIFGMVLQDTWLFSGTIRENIAYGRIGATEAEILNAAKAAFADQFIRTLPDGYDTVINEEASNISYGQKQLLTIARAILSNPAILILDEATSSVDTRTEIYIQQAMDVLMEGRTSFVIAHRLSTIRDADLILVMREGKVIEQGTHDELMKQGEFYADIYNSQFAQNAVAI